MTGSFWSQGAHRSGTLRCDFDVVARGDLKPAGEFMTIKGHRGGLFYHRPGTTPIPAEVYSNDPVGEVATIEFAAGSRWTLKDANLLFFVKVSDPARKELAVALDTSLARASLIRLERGTYALWGYTVTVEKATGSVKFVHGKIVEATDASFK